MEPSFDKDGYPTEDTLRKIEDWAFSDLDELFEFIKQCIHPMYGAFIKDDKKIVITTGGWSGNEDIVKALNNNIFAYNTAWISSNCGGKHEFLLPEIKKNNT